MADTVYELLQPHFDLEQAVPDAKETATSDYLERLSSLSLEGLNQNEHDSLDHEAQTLNRSLQALARRSYKSINSSVDSLEQLRGIVPVLSTTSNSINNTLPGLESAAVRFAEKYGHPSDNAALERRKRALRTNDNADKLSDILELPTILSSTIAAANPGSATGTSSAANATYATALDLYAHIKRLQKLYPGSAIVKSVNSQAEDAMRNMTSNLVTSLRAGSLKLAAAMRLIGLLRRVAPELDDADSAQSVHASAQNEGSLGALFLVSRLANLNATLDALEPLRELADQEQQSTDQIDLGNAWAAGQQTERYLKRYIEIFREQCFAIVSMYKNIFPASLPAPESSLASASSNATSGKADSVRSDNAEARRDDMQGVPPALATFTMHLVDTLTECLRTYLPSIKDSSSRDSLLTQVLYCAGSLGRLGGDFSLVLALLQDEIGSPMSTDDSADRAPEWIEVMKKHRVQAGRLELLASGVTKA